MLTSSIVLVLVLVAGVFLGSRPPWAIQPAMTERRIGTAGTRTARSGLLLALRLDEDDDTSIVLDSLRALGLVRRGVEKPVVGRKAYVRVWERIRAAIVLAVIIITIGVLLAATIGIVVLAAGFLLEQAIA
ncbi:MAG: hypothetical protein R2707_12915 [Acidimicrobiales bacterium]